MPTPVDIIGIGCSSVDFFAVVPVYPDNDAKIEIGEFAKQGGGLVATALVAASRLGATCRYLGRVGDDELCQFMLSSLASDGVDTSRIGIEPGGSTLFAFCVVDSSTGARTIFWTGQNTPELRAEHLTRDDIACAKFLHVDGFDMDAARQACQWAGEAGVTTVIDAEVHHDRMAELVDMCDVIIASEEFACTVTGQRDYRDAARACYARQARLSPDKVVVVTAGTSGSLGVSADGEFHTPAFQVEVVDTTGCGDVFHGAFIYGMLQQWGLPQCARFAAATSALKARQLGGRAGIPTRAEVDAFLASDPDVYA